MKMVIMEYLGYSFLENYQIITKYFELVKNKLQISNKHKFNQNIHNILCYFLLK